MPATPLMPSADLYEQLRLRMIEGQIVARGIRNSRVLEAMGFLPRELFVPEERRGAAYEDRALPIGLGQTISQPYIVALMTEALAVGAGHRVLEIGTGTGYQTAILAMLAGHVVTVERLADLSTTARERVTSLGLQNVTYRVGDGSGGWPEDAPYDRIMVTAAAPTIIPALMDQLTPGGRVIMPIGEEPTQRLTLLERFHGRIVERPLLGVRFVRLIGSHGYAE